MVKVMAFLIGLTLVLSACGAKGAVSSPEPSKVPAVTEPAASVNPAPIAETATEKGIQVDKGLLSNKITLPGSLFKGKTAEQIKADAQNSGVSEVTINADNSVTYKMTKEAYNKMMKETTDAMKQQIDNMKSGKDFKSIKDVKYNSNFTEFTVVVDKAAFEGSFDGFSALGIGISSMFYQAVDGVATEKLKTTIKYEDEKTGNVFNTVVYPDAFK